LTGSTGRTPIVLLSQRAGDVSLVPGLSTTVEQVTAHGSAGQLSARRLRGQLSAPSVDDCAGSVVHTPRVPIRHQCSQSRALHERQGRSLLGNRDQATNLAGQDAARRG
jgi:hypothetical protein